MRIAVIGSGISGLSVSHFLSKKYKVDLFEKHDHFGGHSYTVEVPLENSKDKIRHIISRTAGKNYAALTNWTNENPDYNDVDAKSRYFSLVLSTIGKPTTEVDDKIIQKL